MLLLLLLLRLLLRWLLLLWQFLRVTRWRAFGRLALPPLLLLQLLPLLQLSLLLHRQLLLQLLLVLLLMPSSPLLLLLLPTQRSPLLLLLPLLLLQLLLLMLLPDMDCSLGFALSAAGRRRRRSSAVPGAASALPRNVFSRTLGALGVCTASKQAPGLGLRVGFSSRCCLHALETLWTKVDCSFDQHLGVASGSLGAALCLLGHAFLIAVFG